MLGWRATQGKGAWPLHARIGNRVLAAELRRRVGVPVHDLGPMRAARREDLLALDLHDRRFGYPLEMVVRAAEAGWRIAETAVPYYPREGKSKVTGTVRGTARTVKDMRRVLASIAPAPAPGRSPAPAPARRQPRYRRPRSPRRSGRVTADVYTGKHRREGALGAQGARAHRAYRARASRPRASPPGARRAACWPRRSW